MATTRLSPLTLDRLMRLTVIGSAGTYPVPGRPGPGYLIENRQTRVWCEAGPGTFTGLPIDPGMVDAIVLSHQHPDHCTDLLTAFHSYRYGAHVRFEIPTYCPQSVIDRLLGFIDADPDHEIRKTFAFHPVDDGDTVEIGDLRVSFTETDHSVPTVATRWEDGNRVLAYSADTGPKGEWRQFAKDADVFLCEASYQGEPGTHAYPQHLTATEAGSIARQVGVGALILTHIPPHLDPTRSVAEAEATFDRPVELAVPGVSRKI
jgi:ribonuclease BN (tRNA processing enzyme)